MTPRRIQMSRQRPWRHEHPDAVIVARPSKWGNPYRPVRRDDGAWVAEDDNGVQYPGYGPVADGAWNTRADAIGDCIRLYRDVEAGYGLLDEADIRTELAGRDLACWCPLDQPCHADVLLEIANEERKP